jgi:murein DD-endopeptidase MepM/ murein hydrolase activator NlpD
MYKIFFLFFLLIIVRASGQSDLPQDYFSSPMEIPLVLSGSYGELRNNHFHSGLDIKTQLSVGIPIYAPADGYVHRIKVSHFGYGKALYITHTNGYRTVYAHLKNYAGPIQDYVKKKQYARESYTIELFPEQDLLPVKKGDLIAYSGNSGSSDGPHLHFEIRDSYSRPMNPMLFGIEIPDTRKPIVNTILAYPLSREAQVNNSQNPVKLRLMLQNDGSYKTEKLNAYGSIGFGVSTYDQQNGASNKNGVYEINAINNGEQVFQVQFDRFSFDETRYLNRYIDYGHYKTNKSRVQKLFRQTNNPLSIITESKNDGVITIEEGMSYTYTIEILDFKGNAIKVHVPISGEKSEIVIPREDNRTEDFIYADQATAITKQKFSVYIPPNSLYENTYLDIRVNGDTLHLHDDVVPIHKNITITADVSNYNPSDIDKLFIGRINYKGDPFYNSTTRKGSKLTTTTRTFGSYTVVIDLDPPTIKSVNFSDGQWISKNKTLKLKIKDPLSGISSYRATINDQFILMEYNYKKDLLTYYFEDGITSETENKLKVIVIDNVGNNATFEATFFRK